ncbi:C40 family peptidase [Tissierella sp.]|uniref:C40 family peptidase n=1 Tax=Tissierella sp. TaxID=41274 RepID=UPI002857ABA1|nr:C40 family peptidase [Tissierella sp.]MDR7857140.1 C40 family peptidase [Tissierella sp.]
MHNRKHKLPAVILGICLVALVGFKDTGIFVKDYISIKDDGTQGEFIKQESINVIRENGDNYIVEKEGKSYQIPLDAMIRTTKTTQKYKVIKEASILDKPMGMSLRLLTIGEIVQVLNYENNYGLFNTEDGLNGYIELDNVEVIVTESISYGTSKVDKVIKDDKSFYTLVKGEVVAIKDFKDDIYIIIDENGNEFKANESYIDLRKTKDKTTRSNVSRRASSVTRVIESAYNALGKPYVGGGTGSKGYDCSGLTYSIYLNELGTKLNRTSRDQAKNGVEIQKADLIPGDLVFFRTSGKGIGHVGLYIGDNNMIHASSGRRQVMISSLDESYYKARYVTARRIINN